MKSEIGGTYSAELTYCDCKVGLCEGKESNRCAFKHANPPMTPDKAREVLELLDSLTSMCIGEITMGYRLDAETIGETVHEIKRNLGLLREEEQKKDG